MRTICNQYINGYTHMCCALSSNRVYFISHSSHKLHLGGTLIHPTWYLASNRTNYIFAQKGVGRRPEKEDFADEACRYKVWS